jgi:hypothetical protein
MKHLKTFEELNEATAVGGSGKKRVKQPVMKKPSHVVRLKGLPPSSKKDIKKSLPVGK